MNQTIVALDLETTGLSPQFDAIIEIGAVKFKGSRNEGEFHSLVNPGREIPPEITQLTGITNNMVANAPRIDKVLPQLVQFVGDAPVLGHNVRFDLGFVQKYNYLRNNAEIDTFDLASVLLPKMGRYSLGSLAVALKIPLPATHRALDDARVTAALFRLLAPLAEDLPLEILAEIVNQGRDVNWGGGWAFAQALQEKRRTSGTVGRGLPELFREVPLSGKPLQPSEVPQPLDIPALTQIFQANGALANHFGQYEYRPQQVEMMSAVAKAFSEQNHLFVEAGTGTGKSYAYLVPAIQWAVQNGERVVVSTNTITLQDQLIQKDLPNLATATGIPFQGALLKGRSNYVCPRRVQQLQRRKPSTADEMRLLAKLLVWLPKSEMGDRGEITLVTPGEQEAWRRLSAEDEACTTDRCSNQMEGLCPFFRARRQAERAHVIVVNHALLLADVASENRVLPEYHYLVIDEGHHLETATTDGLSFVGRQADFERRLKELGGANAGLLGQILSACVNAIPPAEFRTLSNEIEKTHDAINNALEYTDGFFVAVREFFDSQVKGNTTYGENLRLTAKQRELGEWSLVEVGWDNLKKMLAPLIEQLMKVAKGLSELYLFDIEDREDLQVGLTSAARHIDEFATQVHGLVSEPQADRIYWIDLSPDAKRLSLHSAPLAVGPLVEKHVWNTKKSVVVASATLTTAGSFEYIRKRLNAHHADQLAVGSPFDYKKSTLVFVVRDAPEPVDKYGHQIALEKGLVSLCRASNGRTVVLFTSHAQLKQTANAIRPPLEQAGIAVYDQSTGSSRTQLLERFKDGEPAVLLGTRSFWEGVDVPGDALSVLAIAKLPFDVPTDPIIAARSETFQNAFNEYAIPEAVLRFRQGFGRLIRTASDRGLVVIFDKRVVTKGYGKQFLGSLPDCTIFEGTLSQLPEATTRWLKARG